MATFQVKTDLPISTQLEIDRITAIASANRSAGEAAFLANFTDILTNQKTVLDDDGLIVVAAGNVLPTGYTGFKKGAIFTDLNVGASTNGLYNNTGDETSATWALVGISAAASIADGDLTPAKTALADGKIIVGNGSGLGAGVTPSGDVSMTNAGVFSLAAAINLASKQLSNLSIESGTPVNAVAASKTFTLASNATDQETVVINGTTYTFQLNIGAGTKASGTLTVSGLPTDLDTVTIGATVYRWRTNFSAVAATKVLTFSDVAINNETVVINGKTYTFKTALTEAKATGTLTLSANPTDGNSVTIGTRTYTFKETIGAADTVLIGVAATNTIDNLIAAITHAAGEGSTYGTGTTAHAVVTAVAGAGDTMDVTALAIGTAGNVATTELSAVCSWGSGTLTGGVNAVLNEVVVAGTAEGNIDNLVAAATAGAGAGTTYSTGTTAPTGVTVSKDSASTVLATASTAGYAGNSIAISETLTNGSWAGGATALSGGNDAQAAYDVLAETNAETSIDNLVLAITAGAGAGTKYGTGTVVHPSATAVKASASTMTVEAISNGDAGNSIATTEAGSNTSFGAATLTGGNGAQAANDVLIGATASDTLDNLIAAINAAAGEGSTYGNGTVVHPTVSAAAGAGDTMDVTAKTKGVAGNSLTISETCANGSWAGGATTLSGGVDGTVGQARKVLVDTSYLYLAIAANTISDANWRRFTVGSVF